MLPIAQERRKRGYLLATGQLTSYGSGAGVDDGALQKGIAKSYTVLTTGQYAGTTNITINAKTDVHSNNCVFDNNTGLMWSRYASASVGPASDGKLPWTTTGSGATAEGIFAYCAAANAALLAGYGDWRVANKTDLLSLADSKATDAYPSSLAFPSFPITNIWASSSTPVSPTTQAAHVIFTTGNLGNNTKSVTYFVLLVRG